MAASAFIWLCSPSSAHSTRPSFRLPRSTSKLCGSPRAHRPPGSSRLVPKRCTSLQQPRASTRGRASSRAFTTRRPLAGTVRTRWWNWVSIAARSGKMSAWSMFQVVQDRRAWPVMHKLAALVEKRGVVFVGFDDKGLARAEARRDTEVQRHAADQETLAADRPAQESTPAWLWCWSCRACRPRPAHARPCSTCSASHCGPLV